MFRSISKFRINGWAVIGLSLLVLAICTSMLSRSKAERAATSAIIGSVPLAQDTAEGPQDAAPKATPAKASNALPASVAAASSSPIQEKPNGGFTYRNSSLTFQVDEINGKRTNLLCQYTSDTTSDLSVCVARGANSKAFMTFDRTLGYDEQGRVPVEVRYILRDGTALVRTYIGVRTKLFTGNSVIFTDPGAMRDIEMNMSRSSLVVARAEKLDGTWQFIRLQADPVMWSTTILEGEFSVIDSIPQVVL